MTRQYFRLLALLIAFLPALAAYAGDEPPVPQPVTPQDGVFKLANGYSATVLELKDGQFRYWFKSDASVIDPATGAAPRYPLTGRYTVNGDTVTLEHSQVFEKQWSFRTVNGVLTLWRPEAIEYYKRKKSFDSYGILRITHKTAEQAWAAGFTSND